MNPSAEYELLRAKVVIAICGDTSRAVVLENRTWANCGPVVAVLKRYSRPPVGYWVVVEQPQRHGQGSHTATLEELKLLLLRLTEPPGPAVITHSFSPYPASIKAAYPSTP